MLAATAITTSFHGGNHKMPTPNYAFEKRKKELAKKQKQQQKQQQKLAAQAEQRQDAVPAPQTDESKRNDK